MNAGHLKKRLRRFWSNRLWMAGSIAAAGSGVALLLATSISQEDPKSAAQLATTTPIAHVSLIVTDPAWDRLSVGQQRTLEPLKRSWSSLTAEQQEKWRLVADRFQAKPLHVQRRLAARIDEWARLTPQQRAHARLNFLELARHYNPAGLPARQAPREACCNRWCSAEGVAASVCAGIARRHNGAAVPAVRTAVAG